MHPNPILLESNAVYDDDRLFALLGITSRTLRNARQSNQLRFTRKGQRILYLGEWVRKWLEADANESERKGVHDDR